MKQETLKRIIDEYVGANTSLDGLSTHIMGVLEQEKLIRGKVNQLREEGLQEKARREDYDKKMRNQWRDVQVGCPHFEYTYFGDPAGGHDSYHVCDLCKKEW